MVIRRFRDRRPRLLAPSRILRPPVRQRGGGREREDLVAEARRIVMRGSRGLAFASRLLDRATRERAWLLYAWCRRGHDIAAGEELGDLRHAENVAQAIRVLTRRALESEPTADAAFDSFGQVAHEAGLTLQLAEDVIEGFALDAAGWQPHSEEDLIRYCYHAAGAAGVMMARIVGVPEDDEETLDRAFELGVAFQLVHIARDLSEDDAAGRCYLPLAWLAETYEASARLGTTVLGFRQRWAVLGAANIHLAIAAKVREAGEQAWDHRITLSGIDKLGAAFRGFMETLDAPLPIDRPVPWSRGQVLVAVRMAGPIAPIPMPPLPDEPIPDGEAE